MRLLTGQRKIIKRASTYLWG